MAGGRSGTTMPIGAWHLTNAANNTLKLASLNFCLGAQDTSDTHMLNAEGDAGLGHNHKTTGQPET